MNSNRRIPSFSFEPAISTIRATGGLLLLLLVSGCGGPLGPLAGGALSGPESPLPEDVAPLAGLLDWQLETVAEDGSPYSVNVWTGVVDDGLYVPTSLILGVENPKDRAWVQNVERDPRIRLRSERKVYTAELERIDDEATVAAAKETILRKYEEESSAHSAAAWIYRVQPRGASEPLN
ncbi:MAG: hypothetical protein AAGE43_10325 [Pseudomonadota bacterium]